MINKVKVFGRIELLLELSFLSLQLRQQFMAEECVNELKTIDDTVSGLSPSYFVISQNSYSLPAISVK